VDNRLIPIILTSIVLLFVAGIAVILYQTAPYTYTFNTTTITTNIPSSGACIKPFNKNYMGWASREDARNYGFGITDTIAPKYTKNPLLFLKVYDGNAMVYAKVISLEKAYQYGSLPDEYLLHYKILILDVIINKSSLSLNVGEIIDVYYPAWNLEVVKQMRILGGNFKNVTVPKVIENVNPRHFISITMPPDVGNEYIMFLGPSTYDPSKIIASYDHIVFDSKVYSVDNVIYPAGVEPYFDFFYKVCGMPLSDFIELVRSVNS
jgi:hypothetical protein